MRECNCLPSRDHWQIPTPALLRLSALTKTADQTRNYRDLITYRQAIRDVFGMAGDEIDSELNSFRAAEDGARS